MHSSSIDYPRIIIFFLYPAENLPSFKPAFFFFLSILQIYKRERDKHLVVIISLFNPFEEENKIHRHRGTSIMEVSSSGLCGSVTWPWSHGPKGCCFNSCSWHMPGLWAKTLVGGMQ